MAQGHRVLLIRPLFKVECLELGNLARVLGIADGVASDTFESNNLILQLLIGLGTRSK